MQPLAGVICHPLTLVGFSPLYAEVSPLQRPLDDFGSTRGVSLQLDKIQLGLAPSNRPVDNAMGSPNSPSQHLRQYDGRFLGYEVITTPMFWAV